MYVLCLFVTPFGGLSDHNASEGGAKAVNREWREPHAGRPARTVFRGIWSKETGPHPTRGTEKLIEYKTYLQALPYFDRLEGDRGVTENALSG